MSLFGRLAVVTGGASGIGKCVCQALAVEGATVVVADINLDAATDVAKALPGATSHQSAYVDVGCSSSVDTLFENAKCHSVPVSVVVNCAGIAPTQADVVDTTEEIFDKVINVNLKGTFLMTRAAGREMIASGVADAVIVNVSSILGKMGMRGLGYYAASKGGVMALTKSAAQELAPKGIRCNAVLPGLTETPMISATSEASRILIAKLTPMGRLGQPEEIAEAIKFLCLPGNSYTTGAMLEVTGGFGM